MRITLPNSPRRIATLNRAAEIHLRVISGSALVESDESALRLGSGLPVTSADGIVSLRWQQGALWMAGDPSAVVEVLLP